MEYNFVEGLGTVLMSVSAIFAGFIGVVYGLVTLAEKYGDEVAGVTLLGGLFTTGLVLKVVG